MRLDDLWSLKVWYLQKTLLLQTASVCMSVIIFSIHIIHLLHCALAAVQCIVIGPVCLWWAGVVCLWVCYHDNSKLCASILTKLGL